LLTAEVQAMRLCQIIPAALSLMLLIGPAWAGDTASGPSALALSALVSENSPTIGASDKQAIATLFSGNTKLSYPAGKKITVSADNIVCRASNVDITQHACDLTFGSKTVTLTWRKAHELFATIAEIGVPPDGALGTIYEGLSQLTCTIDPNAIKQKAGEGADCKFNPGSA